MAYLASIGVSKATMSQQSQMRADSVQATALTSRGSGKRVVKWCVICLVVVALLFSLIGLAHAEEAAQSANSKISDDKVASQGNIATVVRRLDVVDKELAKLRDASGRGVMREQFAASQRQVRNIEQRLTTIEEQFGGDLARDRELMTRKLQIFEAWLNEFKSSIATLSTSYDQWKTDIEGRIAASTEQAAAQAENTESVVSGLIDTEIVALRADLDTQLKNLRWVLFVLGGITVLGISLLIIWIILMEQHMRQAEQSAIARLSETAVNGGDIEKPLSASGKGLDLAAKPREQLKIDPTRPRSKSLPSPLELMRKIIASAKESDRIRVKPMLPSGSWRLGLATNKGYVRSENQDCFFCCKIDEHDVLIVADGCGGIPHGQRAAYLVTNSAADFVIRTYGTAQRRCSPHVKDVATEAIYVAAHSLAVEGDKLNINDVRGGLRTTLIVVIGNKNEVGYAYIGDGGGCVIKTTGEVKRFLDPQKASDLAVNVLAASLGPIIEGEPVNGVMKREAGDLLIVGTDGVFDRVESTFPKDVLRGCIQYKGDLQKTAEHVVEELASFKDTAGYVCDDNLTLGIMGDGTNPKLPQGFWSPAEETKAAQADLSSSGAATQLKEKVS
jgi:serine/threonine protein phosphatase PrpC/phage shock protein PspC (stress-responsive transcriptional regulator)